MGRLPLRGGMTPGLLTTMTLNVAAGESNDAKHRRMGRSFRPPHPVFDQVSDGYLCVGSLTSLMVSNSTLTIAPPTFSTLRI